LKSKVETSGRIGNPVLARSFQAAHHEQAVEPLSTSGNLRLVPDAVTRGKPIAAERA
jgi:hypothetical protein